MAEGENVFPLRFSKWEQWEQALRHKGLSTFEKTAAAGPMCKTVAAQGERQGGNMLTIIETKGRGRKRRRWLAGETCDDCGARRVAAFDLYRDGEAFVALVCGACDWHRAEQPLQADIAAELRRFALEGAGTAAATPG